ncbi:MAG: glycosyltransferase family 2 protein [Thermoleophilia bacterium]|nr:glycosyltransferase family 2 protein [Thermoleophilia bacterium]
MPLLPGQAGLVHANGKSRRVFQGLPYLRTRTRALISIAVGLLWMALSVVISLPWINDLADLTTLPAALMIVFGVALLPGFLNMQLLVSLALDRPAWLIEFDELPDITVLVAAWNEAETIERTLDSIVGQSYPGRVNALVIDDGSTDETVDIVGEYALQTGCVSLLTVEHAGKANALNRGLVDVDDWLVATVDADTVLTPDAIQRAVTRLMQTQNAVAVAGSVLVDNAMDSAVTRMQQWDYLLGIASIKSEQALLQGTLVAQGAFSVYMAPAVRDAGGWPDSIGEDIVLTWGLLQTGGATSYEASAIAYTRVPNTLPSFLRQRRRWARGMVEGLRSHGRALVGQRRLLSFSVGTNMVFPFIDAMFSFAFIPGLILAVTTGNYAIVGPLTVAVLPISFSLQMFMWWRQRRILNRYGIRDRYSWPGYIMYFLFYQFLMSPVSLLGYIQESLHVRRDW